MGTPRGLQRRAAGRSASRRRSTVWLRAALLAAMLVSGACVDGGNDDGGDVGASPSPDNAQVQDGAVEQVDPTLGSFTGGPCDFEAPAGFEPRCGTVTVPADWVAGTGTVELAVAVFPAVAGASTAEPVVFLDGGPGSHTLDSLRFLGRGLLEALTARGDLIFFDQRGVGRSEPALDCPEVTAARRVAEDRPELGDDELKRRFLESLGRCRDRLVSEGVELSLFGTVASAHDVEAIRRALGYPAWNLLGVSYGTRLGLEVLRQHRAGVRSAVLDSVLPAQADGIADNQLSFLDSYELVVQACGDEPACAAGGPLDERIRDLVARYDADPVEIVVTDWLTGETDEVMFTGDALASIVTGALYSPRRFGDLPELATELEDGRTGAAADFLSQDRSGEGLFSAGLFTTIVCREEAALADPVHVERLAQPDPFGLDEVFEGGFNIGSTAFEACEAFAVPPAPEALAAPVRSDVPTLLLAGRFDPVTPVRWAEEAAADLAQSHLVVFPEGSHSLTSDECAQAMVAEFLAAPAAVASTGPDRGCLDDDPVWFLEPPASPIVLEAETWVDDLSQLELSSLQPVGWDVGGIGGDRFRGASFLDPTQVFQTVSVSDGVTRSMVAYVEDLAGAPLSAPVVVDGGWRQRTAEGDELSVEWFEVDRPQGLLIIGLVAPVLERDRLLEDVVDRARSGLVINGP